jgi:hypothetical protein
MSLELPPDPYEVLDVSPGASNQEISAAMARAMKARRHDPRTIAEAQRTLLDPDRRLLADFLRPVLPEVHRWKRFDLAGLEVAADEVALDELPGMDDLATAIRELEAMLDESR